MKDRKRRTPTREEEGEREREKERYPPPLTCYPPHTSTPFSNIASSKRAPALSFSLLHPPLVFLSLPYLSLASSLAPSLFSPGERENGSTRSTKREKGKKGVWVGGTEGGRGGGGRGGELRLQRENRGERLGVRTVRSSTRKLAIFMPGRVHGFLRTGGEKGG